MRKRECFGPGLVLFGTDNNNFAEIWAIIQVLYLNYAFSMGYAVSVDQMDARIIDTREKLACGDIS